MVRLYTKEDIVQNPIMDVEASFKEIQLKGSIKERFFLQAIDNAEFLSPQQFKAENGDIVDISYLSTSCKAALVVLDNPGRIVSCLEVSYLAISDIIKQCPNCSLIIPSKSYPYSDVGVEGVQIQFQGCIYNSFTDFIRR